VKIKVTGATIWLTVSRSLISLVWKLYRLGSIGWWNRLPCPPEIVSGRIFYADPSLKLELNLNMRPFQTQKGHPKAAFKQH